MKKFFMFLSMLLIIFTTVACDGGDDDPTPQPPDEDAAFWDKDGNGVPDWQEKEITLQYATWQYNNPDAETIDTMMIREFMEKYPNITVEMQIVAEDTQWDEAFIGLLETENIPDVFLVRRLENFLPLGILADITDYYDHDPDTDKILASVRDLGVYKGRRYVVPTFIYPQFWIVNLDLLAAANIEAPDYDWTWDQMEAIAKAVANPTTKIIGIYGTAQYISEYPKVLKMQSDPEVGKTWLGTSFDGTKFNFLDDAFLNAVNHMVEAMHEGYLVNQLDAETLLDYYGSENIDPRYAGYVAIWREASWSAKEHIPDFNFNFDIYPAPSGVGGGNTDIAGISSFCEHKDAAYQLLKWMSYGEDGLITRYQLYEEYHEDLFISGNNYPYPIADYGIDGHGVNKVWDNISYGDTAPGLVSSLYVESLRNAALRANKEVIGFDAADEAIGGYFSQIIMGENDYASLRTIIQEAADLAMKNKRDAIDEQLRQ
jgi:multiple sugar transport system substrate-binding protein